LAGTIGHEQTPAYYDQIVGEFFLAGPGARVPPKVASAPPQMEAPADTAPARPAVVRLPRPTSPIEECAAAGGSRYCVSSVLPPRLGNTYGPEKLFDGARGTAWVPENLPRSTGQWVTVEFDGERLVTAIVIDNGYQKNADIYAKNSRVSRIDLAFSDGSRKSYELTDETGSQRLTLDRPVKASWVQLTIADTYPGWKYSDTAISRLVVESTGE